MTMSSETPQRLYLLQLGTSTVPGAGRTLEMVLGCYLVETSDGRHILIDSGLPADAPLPPGAVPSAQGKNVIEQLGDLGLRPDDIDILICTHFDPDHAGYHDAFTKAELIVQREHYELARSGYPRFAAIRAHWDHPALRYRLIDGDTELLPGLTLLETGGHTPGHQSLLVRASKDTQMVFTADACYTRENLDRDVLPRVLWDAATMSHSLAALRHLRDRQGATLFYGHDPDQWQGMRRVPAPLILKSDG